MKFDGMEKKEIYVDRKKHTFYIKERKRNGWGRFYGAESTIYVDDEDNIINIFPGSFKHLDEYILTVRDGIDHMSYYDIRTGEAILTEYDAKGRCFGYFENGIALIYDDDIGNYHIASREGEIGNCCTLRRIGKKSLLVQGYRRDKTLSLYDYNMNIIKKDVSLYYDNLSVNDECFVCHGKDEDGKYYCLCDHLGNIISDKYEKITVKNIYDMQEVTVKERETGNKRKVNYSELIKR